MNMGESDEIEEGKKGFKEIDDFKTGKTHILKKTDFKDGKIRKKIYNDY